MLSPMQHLSIYTTDELESWIAEDDENNLMPDERRNAIIDEIEYRRAELERVRES